MEIRFERLSFIPLVILFRFHEEDFVQIELVTNRLGSLLSQMSLAVSFQVPHFIVCWSNPMNCDRSIYEKMIVKN
jgi:hypothetical protein